MVLLLVTLCALAAPAGAGQPSSGVLEVRETFDPSRGIPIEGAQSYVRVTRAGRVVLHEQNTARRFRRRLRPGRYRVLAYWRVCNGTCNVLSPPSGRCRAPVRIRADDRTLVRVRRNAEGCTATAAQPR